MADNPFAAALKERLKSHEEPTSLGAKTQETSKEASQPLPTKLRIVTLLSGGLDSTTLLYYLRNQGHDVRALSVMYGQRHSREITIASQLCQDLNVKHNVIELGTLGPLLKGSCLTDDRVAVPEGTYTEPSMKKTVVPNRNMVMLSIAAAIAIAEGRSTISCAAHAGDHTIYPDCRPEYYESLQQVLNLCDWKKVQVYVPFLNYDKGMIVTLGAQLGVPFELTWSCYKGGANHCGKCGACNERKEAFYTARMSDPTIYGTAEEREEEEIADGDTDTVTDA